MKLSALYVFLLYLVLFITGCNQVASVEDDTQEDSTSKQKTSDHAIVHIDTVYHTDTIFNISVKPIVHIDTAFQTDTSFNIKSDSTTRFDSAHTSYIDTIHIIKDVYDTIISQHIDTLYLDSTVTDTISRDSSLTDTISKPFIKVDTIHIIDSIPILDTIIQKPPSYYKTKAIDTTIIGEQIWMASNWDIATKESYCYGDSLENCEIYGRLYTWAAARNACPTNWHLPSKEEFERLLFWVIEKKASEALKSTIWWKYGSNGLDSFNFWALPAGIRNKDGLYEGITETGGFTTCFWTSTESDSDSAYCLNLGAEQNGTEWISSKASLIVIDKESAVSLRCIKD